MILNPRFPTPQPVPEHFNRVDVTNKFIVNITPALSTASASRRS